MLASSVIPFLPQYEAAAPFSTPILAGVLGGTMAIDTTMWDQGCVQKRQG